MRRLYLKGELIWNFRTVQISDNFASRCGLHVRPRVTLCALAPPGAPKNWSCCCDGGRVQIRVQVQITRLLGPGLELRTVGGWCDARSNWACVGELSCALRSARFPSPGLLLLYAAGIISLWNVVCGLLFLRSNQEMICVLCAKLFVIRKLCSTVQLSFFAFTKE